MSSEDISALWVTFKLATIVMIVLLVVCVPIAYLLAKGRFRGKRYIQAACNLPMVLPPTVLGFGLLFVMGPYSVIGSFWKSLTGSSLTFSFFGLVLGSLLYSLPFGILPMQAAFEKIDDDLIEAGRALGLSNLQTFFYVVLPNSRGGLAASAALIFAHTVGEFGVALMIGGSIPHETRVISIAIFEHTESINYEAAAILSLVLLVVSYISLVFIGKSSTGEVGGHVRARNNNTKKKEFPYGTVQTVCIRTFD
ncbi:molybdate ABC transporter permease subunit [Halodesulfovibrio sp. MK-HDV]|uniref:molybdate ABC transporter permease subunit n=1 Tax=unclassified Halodesulfovibrio TaxID=2644657 RepID=UPI001371E65E|nr:molybdate ABC transporter permease subunit [Halodesulfovibrio sp. MK-HDV]KAF1077101.1 Molybdenum transport system permease protein ModB [Halodesulfovibrio sp. MK-HDV]